MVIFKKFFVYHDHDHDDDDFDEHDFCVFSSAELIKLLDRVKFMNVV